MRMDTQTHFAPRSPLMATLRRQRNALALFASFLALGSPVCAQIAIDGGTVYTMAGAPIQNGMVLINNGKIERVGPASEVKVPSGYKTMKAAVVTPGLIDARATVGLTGYLNQPQDQDQLEKSGPIQPELRAIDAYDPKERLIDWVRSFGVTTLHTGHAPGALISGQTMIIKTNAETADQAMVPLAMVVGNLGEGPLDKTKSPGTRAKEMAMLRTEFIKAQEYNRKHDGTTAKAAEATDKTADKKSDAGTRDLRQEILGQIVKGQVPLLITAHRANDIMSAIRLANEFHLKLVIDGGSEIPLVIDRVKASGYPVILHPTMDRSFSETENNSMETASKLKAAGIPFAIESGFEDYVPKTRVVLFEASEAAANGLSQQDALASITINAARLLGIDKRVGSLESGKDADIAMYDGDPLEYTTHCTGVIIDGKVAADSGR